MALFRTLLFAPGNHARRVEKVFTVGADGVILDLEDAVAIAEKPGTRKLIVAALQQPRSCSAYVRVNAMDTPFCYADLVEVVGLLAIDWLLEQLERERGLPRRSVDLIPIIETARGIANLAAIMGAGSRVRRCSFGAGDFTFDANVVWTRAEAELAHARAQMVIQSRAAGLEAPMDSVWVDLQDAEGLEASARAVKRMGFQGKTCIHPNQIPVVNAVFSPTAEELAFARKVVAAFEAAEAAGSAAFQIDGKFVDYPIVYRAQRIVKDHEAIAAAGRAA